jgi:AcrR family transcriptional regulator
MLKVPMPRKKATRPDWAAVMLDLIRSGRDPASITVAELCGRLDVARTSFYRHYPQESGGLAALQGEVISSWLSHRLGALPGSAVAAVREPADRLRMLRVIAAENAVTDRALRVWALSDSRAADAVTQADEVLRDQVQHALADMGFSEPESSSLAGLLASAYAAPGNWAFDAEIWEHVLGALSRASSGDRTGVQIASGSTSDEFVLYITPELPPARQELLRQLAQEFARDQADRAGTPRDIPAAG